MQRALEGRSKRGNRKGRRKRGKILRGKESEVIKMMMMMLLMKFKATKMTMRGT